MMTKCSMPLAESEIYHQQAWIIAVAAAGNFLSGKTTVPMIRTAIPTNTASLISGLRPRVV
jgi:hypothetical protein